MLTAPPVLPPCCYQRCCPLPPRRHPPARGPCLHGEGLLTWRAPVYSKLVSWPAKEEDARHRAVSGGEGTRGRRRGDGGQTRQAEQGLVVHGSRQAGNGRSVGISSAALGRALAAQPAQQAALAPWRQPQHLARILRWGRAGQRQRAASARSGEYGRTRAAQRLPLEWSQGLQPTGAFPPVHPPPPLSRGGRTDRGVASCAAPQLPALRRRRRRAAPPAGTRSWPAAQGAGCPARACCRCRETPGARLARRPWLRRWSALQSAKAAFARAVGRACCAVWMSDRTARALQAGNLAAAGLLRAS